MRNTGTTSALPGVTNVVGSLLTTFETQYGAQLIGATIVRVRGIMQCGSTAASGLQQGRWGLTVSEETPAAVDLYGLGAHKDWFAWEPLMTQASQSGSLQFPGATRIIDVRSARKIDELGADLYAVMTASGGNTAATTFRADWDLSFGIKLP